MGCMTLAQTQKRHAGCDKVKPDDARSQVGSQAGWAKAGHRWAQSSLIGAWLDASELWGRTEEEWAAYSHPTQALHSTPHASLTIPRTLALSLLYLAPLSATHPCHLQAKCLACHSAQGYLISTSVILLQVPCWIYFGFGHGSL